ncbi:hypothetical protein P1X14_05695 [Sphingomonas sp. AOB5]|uniref:DUF6916 family protein n=1 Tax=Sphingomonas sp. AOB5 TaxID=3034017 RepID=UPI0023F8D7C9|nr:hypothetical protein [Sphingomonas sp. AOB5]MDF7774733.1 hypothetical protein [Sphingomonas sp. AOB5]
MSEGFAPSRRQFFAAGAVAAAALPGASSMVSAMAGTPIALKGHDEWQAHIGKQFVLDGTASMKLVAVHKGGRQPGAFGRGQFSAVFELDRAAPSDGTFSVANAELGYAELYMQPGKSQSGKPTLYAAFS